ncbi:unnamed protein product [Prorocentrum cordatum]|uniref:Calcineurin-like phosphoesterase domain-containing protein n=1 Tax=Prorocentrum cordatum TaxID=2364126 RepID=A0ABN9RHS4_9DINO|nr:unnamed protein product [Polarella glacialis]
MEAIAPAQAPPGGSVFSWSYSYVSRTALDTLLSDFENDLESAESKQFDKARRLVVSDISLQTADLRPLRSTVMVLGEFHVHDESAMFLAAPEIDKDLLTRPRRREHGRGWAGALRSNAQLDKIFISAQAWLLAQWNISAAVMAKPEELDGTGISGHGPAKARPDQRGFSPGADFLGNVALQLLYLREWAAPRPLSMKVHAVATLWRAAEETMGHWSMMWQCLQEKAKGSLPTVLRAQGVVRDFMPSWMTVRVNSFRATAKEFGEDHPLTATSPAPHDRPWARRAATAALVAGTAAALLAAAAPPGFTGSHAMARARVKDGVTVLQDLEGDAAAEAGQFDFSEGDPDAAGGDEVKDQNRQVEVNEPYAKLRLPPGIAADQRDVTQSTVNLPTSPTPLQGGEGCTSRFQIPPMPQLATDYNGAQLPDTCFSQPGGADGHFHVYLIGDWGGLPGPFGWNGSMKAPAPADHRSPEFPSHQRNFIWGADDCAQRNIAEQMAKMAAKNPPDYILNVGDNFYWGGINVKCGGHVSTVDDSTQQWQKVFEDVYVGDGIDGKQWLGVLGNHDFGGFMFVGGWDQAIHYTWMQGAPSTGRWVTPSLYYGAKVVYPDFSIDYLFIDTNNFDAWLPHAEERHNLCSRNHNPPNMEAMGSSTRGPAHAMIGIQTCYEAQPKGVEQAVWNGPSDGLLSHGPAMHIVDLIDNLVQQETSGVTSSWELLPGPRRKAADAKSPDRVHVRICPARVALPLASQNGRVPARDETPSPAPNHSDAVAKDGRQRAASASVTTDTAATHASYKLPRTRKALRAMGRHPDSRGVILLDGGFASSKGFPKQSEAIYNLTQFGDSRYLDSNCDAIHVHVPFYVERASTLARDRGFLDFYDYLFHHDIIGLRSRWRE